MAEEEVASFFARLGLKLEKDEWNTGTKVLENLQKVAKTVAAAFAAREIGEFIGATVEAGAKAQKMGEELGISAESASELAYVAKRSETDIDTLGAALGHLAKDGADQLTKGKGPMIDAFHKLGLSTDELKKKMTGPGGADDILEMISEKFSDLPPGMTKSAAAAEIFGAKMGQKLLPLLDNGIDGFKELRAEAHELGQTFTQDQADGYDTLEENWGRVKDGIHGVGNEIVNALQPLLIEASEWLVGVVKDVIAWIQDHGAELRSFFEGVGSYIKFMAHLTYESFKLVIEIIEDVYDVIYNVVNGLIMFAKAIYDYVIEPVIEAVSFAVKEISKLAEWVFGTVLKPIWDALVEVFNSVVEFLEPVWAALVKVKDAVTEFFQQAYDIGKRIVDAFVEVGEAIKQAFEDAFNYISELPVVKQILDAVEWARNKANGEDPEPQARADADLQAADARAAAEAQAAAGSPTESDRIRALPGASATPGAAPTAPVQYNNSPQTTSVAVHIGTVTAAPGADPGQFAEALKPHMERVAGDVFDRHLTHAANSVEGNP